MADIWDTVNGLMNDAIADTSAGFGVDDVWTHTDEDGAETALQGADFQLLRAGDPEYNMNGEERTDQARLDVKTSVLASAADYTTVTGTDGSEWTVTRTETRDGMLRLFLDRTDIDERSGGMRRSR